MAERWMLEARRYGFLQWLRLWSRSRFDRGRRVDLQGLMEDGLDIRNAGGMSFPTGDLARAEVRGEKVLLEVHFMGLNGSVSPLPAYFLEGVTRGREEYAPLKGLLDLLDGRIYRLLGFGLMRRRPGLRTELGASDQLLERLAAMAGELKEERRGRSLAQWSFLANRSKAGLEGFLESVLGIGPVVVDDLRVQSIPNPAPASLNQVRLDGTCAIGNSVRVAGAKLAISIGPLPAGRYLSVARRRDVFEGLLKELVAEHLDIPRSWEVQIGLDAEGLRGQSCRLDGKALLGRYAWIGSLDEQKQEMIIESD